MKQGRAGAPSAGGPWFPVRPGTYDVVRKGHGCSFRSGAEVVAVDIDAKAGAELGSELGTGSANKLY